MTIPKSHLAEELIGRLRFDDTVQIDFQELTDDEKVQLDKIVKKTITNVFREDLRKSPSHNLDNFRN